jgi:hypothetical protein
MPAQHGTHSRYVQGCRCADCTEAHRAYAALCAERKRDAEAGPPPAEMGRVEAAVVVELAGLEQAEARPGLAQLALALARDVDNPKALNQHAAASAKLADLLDKLRKGGDVRRSRLASVRAMTSAKSATDQAS